MFGCVTDEAALAEFSKVHLPVFELAWKFSERLEESYPDLLAPQSERGRLEIYPRVGALVARNVLGIDVVSQISQELLIAQVGLKDVGNGWGYHKEVFLKPNQLPPDSLARKLLDIYSQAVEGEKPVLGMNEYTSIGEEAGRGSSHHDSNEKNPTVLFGDDNGYTKIATRKSTLGESGIPLRSSTFFDLHIEGRHEHIITGVGDILFFDGRKRRHQGWAFGDQGHHIRRTVVLANLKRYVNK